MKKIMFFVSGLILGLLIGTSTPSKKTITTAFFENWGTALTSTQPFNPFSMK